MAGEGADEGDEEREEGAEEDWTASEAGQGGVAVSKPAQVRRRRISVMALRRVVIELDLTGGFFSVPSALSAGCEGCCCCEASAEDSRTRLASSARSWFMVSRRWRSSRMWVARRFSRAVRREMESTFFLLRTLTPWRRKTFFVGAGEEAEAVAVIVSSSCCCCCCCCDSRGRNER